MKFYTYILFFLFILLFIQIHKLIMNSKSIFKGSIAFFEEILQFLLIDYWFCIGNALKMHTLVDNLMLFYSPTEHFICFSHKTFIINIFTYQAVFFGTINSREEKSIYLYFSIYLRT